MEDIEKNKINKNDNEQQITEEINNNKINKIILLLLFLIIFILHIYFTSFEKFIDLLKELFLPIAISLSTYLYNKNQLVLENKKYNKENYNEKIQCIRNINNYIDLLTSEVVEYTNQKVSQETIKSLKTYEINSLLIELKMLFGKQVEEQVTSIINLIFNFHLHIKNNEINKISFDVDKVFNTWKNINTILEKLLQQEFCDENHKLKF